MDIDGSINVIITKIIIFLYSIYSMSYLQQSYLTPFPYLKLWNEECYKRELKRRCKINKPKCTKMNYGGLFCEEKSIVIRNPRSYLISGYDGGGMNKNRSEWWKKCPWLNKVCKNCC
ncbi:MAG: hypothetical protein QW303_03050 [Nitrososphaerota archaeon]